MSINQTMLNIYIQLTKWKVLFTSILFIITKIYNFLVYFFIARIYLVFHVYLI